MNPSRTPSQSLAALQDKALKAGLARYLEHLKMHGRDPNMTGHTPKAIKMLLAFRALHEGTK